MSGEGSAALIQPHPDRALGALQRELSGSFEAAAEPRSSGSPGPAGINGVWKGGAADGDGTPPGGSKE